MAKKDKKQTDYVAHGSLQHANLLGLRKVEAGEVTDLILEGWTLADPTAPGPQVTDTYLRELLRSKVSVLQSGKPVVPPGAPPMFVPSRDEELEDFEPVSGIV